MLVLTRKRGQMVLIGNKIKVKIVSINRRRVMLGFTAPSGLLIQRNELRAALKEPSVDASPHEDAKTQE